MTYEEICNYYNLKPLTDSEVKMKFRNLGMFDDFNDDDEVNTNTNTKNRISERQVVDHTGHMTSIRNQGGCGSCWAFATMSAVEGCWNKSHTIKLTGWLSTQQLVDCDKSNGGCNGGWYSGAMAYLQGVKANYDKDYPYKAVRGTCTISSITSPVQIKETTGIYNSGYSRDADWVNLMLAGPVAVAIEATSSWMGYRSGYWDGPCKGRVTHAVTLVGFGIEAAGREYYVIRNSWGNSWGENGHMKMAVNRENNQTCFLEAYGFAPKSFTA
jgi:C1A family cysteine protease